MNRSYNGIHWKTALAVMTAIVMIILTPLAAGAAPVDQSAASQATLETRIGKLEQMVTELMALLKNGTPALSGNEQSGEGNDATQAGDSAGFEAADEDDQVEQEGEYSMPGDPAKNESADTKDNDDIQQEGDYTAPGDTAADETADANESGDQTQQEGDYTAPGDTAADETADTNESGDQTGQAGTAASVDNGFKLMDASGANVVYTEYYATMKCWELHPDAYKIVNNGLYIYNGDFLYEVVICSQSGELTAVWINADSGTEIPVAAGYTAVLQEDNQ